MTSNEIENNEPVIHALEIPEYLKEDYTRFLNLMNERVSPYMELSVTVH